MADEEMKRLADKVAQLEAKTTKRAAKGCEHDIVVRQDPQSGDHELLACTLCDMEPRRRVAAAASIKTAAEAQMAEMRRDIEALSERTKKADEMRTSEIDALADRLAKISARLAKLEAFGGVS